MNRSLLYSESLARYCTFEIGGPARYLWKASCRDSLLEGVSWAKKRGLPWVVVGRGSNILFDDRGFQGVVLAQRFKARELERVKVPSAKNPEKVRLIVDGGWSLPQLAAKSVREGLGGLEFGCAIPGSLAGAVYMNAGAHGSDMASILERVEFLDEEGKTQWLSKEELLLSYRTSIFQRRNWIILRAQIALFLSDGAQDNLLCFARTRRAKQPQHCRSAGCFFRNPASEASAGKLIDKLGFKGWTHGPISVSDRHANFLIHRTDGGEYQRPGGYLLEAIEEIRREVYSKTGHHLESEVRFLPYDGKQFCSL